VPASVNDVTGALKAAAQNGLRDILAYTEDPVVSSDFKQAPHSAIVDGASTRVLDNKLIRVVAWYDNEWAYANRVADLVRFVASEDSGENAIGQETEPVESYAPVLSRA
jgi:glyceraldehyde 3-phosphate dehydrogenase